MKTDRLPARIVSLLLIVLLFAPQQWATCGGGGGGGMGGVSGGTATETYRVSWKLVQSTDQPPVALAVYWLPASQNEINNSSLNYSRKLSLYAGQCVTMGMVDYRTAIGKKYIGEEQPPLALLVGPDGNVLGKVEKTKDGKLRVEDVEKLLDTEIKTREGNIKQQMDDAKAKAKSGDSQGAIQLYRAVYEQKCLFPNKAKDAQKELKKLGVTDVAEVPAAPNFDAALSARIERTMRRGLEAENDTRYVEAGRLYSQAHHMDPADPVPLRYLGELYRHHVGDWERARQAFESILAMPADPISRAVALHGLGKMTIHEGEFKKGLALMERSVEEFPLALAYRNLAVYWNSEGDAQKTDFYTHKALELDPHDAFNLIFVAAFLADKPGRGDEALKIARENEALLPASYNLAAIYAQLGEKDKALALLRRHFFEYERYRSVRTKEMMEARVDAVFASLRTDPAFLALTSEADGRLPMPMPKSAGQ